ncbi:phage portal protein [Bacillaceae bacterium]
MGVRDWLARFTRKENPVSKLIALMTGPGQPVWTPQRFDALAKEGYARNVWVYKCVDMIAKAVAGVPWLVFRVNRLGDRRELNDPNHPLVKLLRRPNPRQGQARFFVEVTSFLLLDGNSYVVAVGPRRSEPREMWPMRPDRMKPIAGSDRMVQGYEYEVGSRKARFDAEEVLHLTLFNPTEDYYGLAPTTVAARSIDMDNAADAWNTALLQNRARPDGALTVEGKLHPDVRDDLERQIQEKYSGKNNAGRPLLLDGGMKWQQIGFSPADMDWTNLKSITRLQICTAFGVPPELLGDHEHATYSNYQEARKGFYHETVLPLLDYIRDELNAWLAPRFGERIVIDYDIDAIEAIQEDREKVWKMAMEAADKGLLKVNEARFMMNHDDVEGGDVRLVPVNRIPVGPDAEQEEPDDVDDDRQEGEGRESEEQDENNGMNGGEIPFGLR